MPKSSIDTDTLSKISFWSLIFQITGTITMVIAFNSYNASKHFDRILLELYLAGEIDRPLRFNYNGYIEDLQTYDQFLNGNRQKITEADTSKINKNPIQLISQLRGGKKFPRLPNNWKKTRPIIISRIGIQIGAICILCGTVGLTTQCLLNNLNGLRKLTTKDIVAIQQCIDTCCKAHNIKIYQLPFNQKVWEALIDSLYWCLKDNLEFQLTKPQYFLIFMILKSVGSPLLFPLFIFLMSVSLGLGLLFTGVSIYLIATGNLILATFIVSGLGSFFVYDILTNKSLLFKSVIQQLLQLAIAIEQLLSKQPQLPINNDYPVIRPSSPYIERPVPKGIDIQKGYPLEKKPNPYTLYDNTKSIDDILKKYHSKQTFDTIEKSDLPTIEYNPKLDIDEPNP